MSGFVVGFGSPEKGTVEEMFSKIRHRGPDLQGAQVLGKAVMAQNYLKADNLGDATVGRVPLQGPSGACICWDGEIGNLPQMLTEQGVSFSALSAERLLLQKFEEEGPKVLDGLDDAVFTLVISDGENLFAARDLLGIKTLFYGRKDGALYLASELKALTDWLDDVREFPAGHYMDSQGDLHRYASLPSQPPAASGHSLDEVLGNIRSIISRSLASRVDFSRPTASLLSGGIDSSIIATLAAKAYAEKFGKAARLKTFALGVGESEDIKYARLVAEKIGSQHKELIVSLDDLVKTLPQVIYQLESFDPSLVRSAASNYLISRYAREQGVEVLLSGEGGDEVFCGYLYLKDLSEQEIFAGQMEVLGFLHNNASLRLDRMNQCHGVRVIAPLISGELLAYSLSLPVDYRIHRGSRGTIEKWIFRKAYEADLPQEVAWRLKQEFSQGSGSAGVLPQYFENKFSDEELAEAQSIHPMIRSKEELHYFRLFAGFFGDKKAVETVGQWPLL